MARFSNTKLEHYPYGGIGRPYGSEPSFLGDFATQLRLLSDIETTPGRRNRICKHT